MKLYLADTNIGIKPEMEKSLSKLKPFSVLEVVIGMEQKNTYHTIELSRRKIEASSKKHHITQTLIFCKNIHEYRINENSAEIIQIIHCKPSTPFPESVLEYFGEFLFKDLV